MPHDSEQRRNWGFWDGRLDREQSRWPSYDDLAQFLGSHFDATYARSYAAGYEYQSRFTNEERTVHHG